MRFEFHITNAAQHNTPSARLREQTRMAMVCYSLQRLGHDAVIADCSDCFRASPRWQFFCHLQGKLLDAIQVLPAETLTRNRPGAPTVAWKSSAGWSRDAQILPHCDLAVFHEYDVAFEAHPKLLPIPFTVHDCIVGHWIEQGLFEAYLHDELETIRAAYRTPKTGIAGFLGVGHYGRKEKAVQLPEFEFRFNDSPVFTPDEYLRWLSRFYVGFNMEGETPKSYRFAEHTVLGIVNAAPPCATRITPKLNDRNSILMRDWSDADAVKAGVERFGEIVAEADRCYVDGWSPTGIARLIARAME